MVDDGAAGSVPPPGPCRADIRGPRRLRAESRIARGPRPFAEVGQRGPVHVQLMRLRLRERLEVVPRNVISSPDVAYLVR